MLSTVRDHASPEVVETHPVVVVDLHFPFSQIGVLRD